MKDHVIRLLTVLAGAALTSAWWAAAMFRTVDLWLLATLVSIPAFVFLLGYVAFYWDDKKEEEQE